MANHALSFRGRTVRYEETHYTRDPDSGRFLKRLELVDFPRLPAELKTEHTQDERIRRNGADQIITGRFRQKRREFFTGLRKTGFPELMHGNDADRSEVLFLFAPDFAALTVFHFTGWRCYPAERTAFHAEFMLHLRRRGFTF